MAVKREPKADHLLTRTAGLDFQLLNEPGAITWSRGQSDAVLDLGFASQGLAPWIMAYKPRGEWALIQDHFPIEIRIDIGISNPRKGKRYALQKADWKAIIDCVHPSL